MPRHRSRADDGFSLVEVLVVMLILSGLVAAAIPSLLTQRSKAQDTNAKTVVATAAKAATAHGTDHGGFTGLTRADLVSLEKSLDSARNLQVDAGAGTFTVSVDSAAGGTYSIARAADGRLTRDCAPAGSGGCREQLDARGNRW